MASESPIVSGIAGRYASALFELAQDSGALDAVDADLTRFLGFLNDSEDLERLCANPVFKPDQQVAAVSAVLQAVGISGIAANIIKLLAAKGRLFLVRGVINAFRALLAESRGVVGAEVTVAAPLSDANRAAVLEALNAVAGGKVALSEKVDPSIIGGLVVKIGSRMVDASVKTKLNAMKLAMKEVG